MAIADLEPVPADIADEEIDTQLAKMLESHHFCHSHRYPALLKYLVEQTRVGKSHLLKERLVGVQVFHRAPDYDTNTDPVVRVTAAEVRKRIAQYYQEPEHGGEIRIDLPIGTYVPRFFRTPVPHGRPAADPVETDPPTLHDASGAEPAQSPLAEDLPRTSSTTPGWLPRNWVLAAAVALGVVIGVAAVRFWDDLAFSHEHRLTEFWAPFAAAEHSAVVVIGDHTVGYEGNALRSPQGAAASPSEDVLKLMNEYEQITLTDVESLFKVTNYMVRHHQTFNIAGAGAAEIADLRTGPVLLFAGLDNRWTMRLAQHLRYRFVDSPDNSVGIIEDAQTPGRTWQVDFKVPYNKMPMDYAIVARYYDPLLEQPVMIAAGLGATGTVSASEFVTSERLIEDMNKLAPKGWKHGNVEVVLALPVIDGHAGPPHIVASQFW